jgi:DNA polymerase III subunit delta
VPTFRPAYLICGDDHGRITARRSRLRAMAERESGAGGVELLEGEAGTPDAVAAALSAMTFALGRRFVIVEGVERWKEADVAVVADAMKGIDADTLTVAFFGREEGRYKVPAALRKAVEAAGGQIAEETNVKARDLPRFLVARAAELGVELDTQGARALIAHVGDRQQRLQRELEKLALEHGQGARLGVEEVEESSTTPPSARRGRSPTRWSPATSARRRARCSSCASRASACQGCSTGWCDACATR